MKKKSRPKAAKKTGKTAAAKERRKSQTRRKYVALGIMYERLVKRNALPERRKGERRETA
jgi:hypothetical protein